MFCYWGLKSNVFLKLTVSLLLKDILLLTLLLKSCHDLHIGHVLQFVSHRDGVVLQFWDTHLAVQGRLGADRCVPATSIWNHTRYFTQGFKVSPCTQGTEKMSSQQMRVSVRLAVGDSAAIKDSRVLLWRFEFDRKVGALSLRLPLALSGRVGCRKDWADDGNGAGKEKNSKRERRFNHRALR